MLIAASRSEASSAFETDGTVAGQVEDETGGALQGVVVTIRSDSGQSRLTLSDSAGRYGFAGVQPGHYVLLFELLDFVAYQSHVEVRAEKNVQAKAVLRLSLIADVSVIARPLRVSGSAGEGAITAKQIGMRPMLQVGEIVESVPGVIVSQHSGDGKANQYYLRGFNLDHGTDFAVDVARVPVNMPTHAHGQGYTDLNFFIPELVTDLQFKKGPYFADEGDFSSAGAVDLNYATSLDRPLFHVAFGDNRWARVVAAASPRVGMGHLLVAAEADHNDGPWQTPGDSRKAIGVLRYTQGDALRRFSLTGMTYQASWKSTNQVPARAVQSGRISRFEGIDSSDGGNTYRHSLSFDAQRSDHHSSTRANAFVVGYGLDLFSNFTYFLDDPANGDQFELNAATSG